MELDKDIQQALENVSSEIKTSVKAMIENAVNGYMKTDDLSKQLETMQIDGTTIKEIAAATKAQGDKIKEMIERQTEKLERKSVAEIIKENMDNIKSLSGDKRKTVNFIVPKTTVATSSITSDAQTYHLPAFNDTGIAPATIEEAWRRFGNVQNIPANSHGVISYTDLTTRTNNAAMTAEGSVYPENAYAWTGYTKTIEKAITSIPVTWESLNDIDQMEATIRRLLTADLVNVKEAQLMTGTGTAPQVQGLYTAAQTAAPSGTTIQTSSPNIYDLAMWMKRHVVENYGSKFLPNVLFLNNGDALNAKWTKDELGNYVRNPFVSPDGMTVDGMFIVETPKVTAGTMLIGDMRYASLYIGNGVEIEIGLDGNDFTYDLYTLKARQRFCVVIPTPDTYGFLKSTAITTDLAYIETAGA